MKKPKTPLATLKRFFLALFLTLIPFSLYVVYAATFVDNDSADFGNGTHAGTQWDSGNSWLEADATNTVWQLPNNASATDWFNMEDNVLLYRMNETAANSGPGSSDFEDFSGNSRHGNATSGLVYGQTGKLDKAGQFNGASYIDAGTFNAMDTVNKKLTMSAWIYNTGVTHLADYIFTKGNDVTASSYGLCILSDYRLRANVSNQWATSTTILKTNIWYHVAGVIDGQNIRVYLNGVLEGSGTYSGTISDTALPVRVGSQDRGGYEYYFNGKIDEVAIFDDVLTETEIRTIYERQLPLYSGYFTSRIMNAGASTTWNTVAWTPQRPLYKELPGSAGTETAYNAGNIDMTGNALLMHMNEASWNGTANEVVDSSGQGNHGVRSGNATTASGKFDRGGTFDGSGDYVSFGNTGLPLGSNPRTLAVWFKTGVSTAHQFFVNYGSNLNGQRVSLSYWNTGILQVETVNSGRSFPYTPDNQWHHFAAVLPSGQTSSHAFELYFDGQLQSVSNIGSPQTLNTTNSSPQIGKINALNDWYLNGQLDEVLIFSRGLSDTEILDIYKRGATRLKYHVRSCNDNVCSGESFIGPDGTTATYYSELSNTGLGLPSLSLTNVPDNQYFQYRAFLESDSASYSPELKNVTVSYTLVSAPEDIPTTAETANTSPVFVLNGTDAVSDGGTATTALPAIADDEITFTAKATDNNLNPYYLAICKTNAINAVNSAPPTCPGSAWAITTTGNQVASGSAATLTYTVTGSEPENNAWHAFVCDHSSASACYPTGTSPQVGDRGFATGTITFNGIPADGDYFTIDGVLYEADGTAPIDCAGGQTEGYCLNTSTAISRTDTAANLATNEIGPNSHMVARSNTVYVYADAAGVSGNSIAMTIGTCPNCALSGATLTGGDDDNASPFYVNHAPDIGAVNIGSAPGGTGAIEPGDTIYFNATITDGDTEGGADTVDMYVCSTDSFTAGVGCGGTTLCSALAQTPGAIECDDGGSLAPIPTAHTTGGALSVYIFAQDSHLLTDAETTHAHTYDVADVAPELISYTATDVPAPSAGGYDTVSFTVYLSDGNGEGDVTEVNAVFFDKDTDNNPDGNACSSDEKNCYLSPYSLAACEPDANCCNISAAYGDSSQLQADCQVIPWFNANASDWDVQAEAVDGDTPRTTEFADAGVTLTNPALLGLNLLESSIDYGTVYAGSVSAGKTTTIQNAGNQILDILLDGSNMCTDYPTCSGGIIANSRQKWHHNSSSFDWDNAASAPGPYTLVTTASGTDDETGCLNRNIGVRTDHTSGSTDELLYWRLRIQESQASGSYMGANTFIGTGRNTCVDGEEY